MKVRNIVCLLLSGILCMSLLSCTNAQRPEYKAYVLADSLYEDEAASPEFDTGDRTIQSGSGRPC